ncbi:acyl-CoA N-acyltransferase [Thelonectria olida]|uniref:Acyl-CoA N-acyltransferase n=1 Tax=Thelonectria olida TaxID=1576542 RepID=A0A9P8VVF0_9HYPO|nr:acyl-CoA N-acyltransferase [Thelonectria olida]
MTNANLQFRIATTDDAPRIRQLVEAAFQAEDSRPDWTADMELGRNFRIGIDEILPKITGPDSDILIATDDNDALVASVAIWRRDASLARFALLSVDQTRQQGGVGRKVLAHAEDYCRREWGVDKFGLNALSTRQELISWYGRCGYRKTGELTPFPVEKINGRDVPEELCFVELEKELGAERAK